MMGYDDTVCPICLRHKDRGLHVCDTCFEVYQKHEHKTLGPFGRVQIACGRGDVEFFNALRETGLFDVNPAHSRKQPEGLHKQVAEDEKKYTCPICHSSKQSSEYLCQGCFGIYEKHDKMLPRWSLLTSACNERNVAFFADVRATGLFNNNIARTQTSAGDQAQKGGCGCDKTHDTHNTDETCPICYRQKSSVCWICCIDCYEIYKAHCLHLPSFSAAQKAYKEQNTAFFDKFRATGWFDVDKKASPSVEVHYCDDLNKSPICKSDIQIIDSIQLTNTALEQASQRTYISDSEMVTLVFQQVLMKDGDSDA